MKAMVIVVAVETEIAVSGNASDCDNAEVTIVFLVRVEVMVVFAALDKSPTSG